MDKVESSMFENMSVNISTKNEQTLYQSQAWGIRDFNNVETADRKLLVNKKYEFWIHEAALAANSDLFAYSFGKIPDLGNTLNVSMISTHQEDDYTQTDINVPHEELFFDLLLWIYTKDAKKLKKAAKTFQPFMYLISLGIFLQMKTEFFEILLTSSNFDWKVESFSDPLWSKTIFTFPILERIVKQIPSNYTKLIALLSWLKEIDPSTKNVITSSEVLEGILTSNDLFYVRNYIKQNHLMQKLSADEISSIYEKFPHLHSSLDASAIVDELIFGNKLICIVCKKEFDSPFSVINDMKCERHDITGENNISNNNSQLGNETYFHPKHFVKSEKVTCTHEGCGRKLMKGEYPCCHRKIEPKDSNGCQLSDGKHMLVFLKDL